MGTLASTNVAQLTSTSSLTGGGAGVTHATTVAGVAPSEDNERTISVALIDAAGQPVSGAIKTAVDDLLQAEREVNFLVFAIDPTYTTIDVSFTATILSGYDADETIAAAEAAVASYLDPATWGQALGSDSDDRNWRLVDKARYLEMAFVINNTPGIDYVTVLTLGINGGAQTAADKDLAGKAPLPNAGTIVGTAA
jgi:hypothetical protein